MPLEGAQGDEEKLNLTGKYWKQKEVLVTVPELSWEDQTSFCPCVMPGLVLSSLDGI